MPKLAEIAIETRVEVVVLHKEGHSERAIAKKTGISNGGVHCIIKNGRTLVSFVI